MIYDIVHLSSTIASLYGAEHFHEIIPPLKERLEKEKGRPLIVFLFDGLGRAILEKHEESAESLLKHKFMVIEAVTPATTVASTSAFLSGKYPSENGYLGWTMRLLHPKRYVEVFSNKDIYKGEVSSEKSVAELSPYSSLIERIEKKGYRSCSLFPDYIAHDGYKNLLDGFSLLDKRLQEGYDFIYFYYPEPDGSMHEYGTMSPIVDQKIKEINDLLSDFHKDHPKTLLLTMADHGLIDVEEYLDIAKYPEIIADLDGTFAIEGRLPTFFVKPGAQKRFYNNFQKYFPTFVLKDREEVKKEKILGPEPFNSLFEESLGDFLAYTYDRKILFDSRLPHSIFKAHHAGKTLDEREIMLGIYS